MVSFFLILFLTSMLHILIFSSCGFNENSIVENVILCYVYVKDQ